MNRKQVDYTNRLSDVVEAMKGIAAGNFVIDSELVVYDENGRTWFEGSQRRCSTQDMTQQSILKLKYPVVVLAFDVVRLDGKDLANFSWQTRKELLRSLLRDSLQTQIVAMPHVIDRKREYYESVVAQGEEGLILKDVHSPYTFDRSRHWLKVKKWYEERCRVVGYTPGDGKRDGLFGSLILARPDDAGVFRYAGKVGSGFNDADLGQVFKVLREGVTQEPLVDARDELGKPIDFTSVNIDLEVTVKFYETSKNGVYRFPSLLKDKQGRNLIHYGASTINGKVQTRQSDLKSLLESLRR